LPEICPGCGYKLIQKSKELLCNNPKCFQKNIQITSHFFIEMGVVGFSDKSFENLRIVSIPEIYQLTKEKLEKIPGFGEKKAEIIVEQVKKTLNVTPEKLLSAFGLPLIGKTLSKDLCKRFTLDELFEIKDPEVIGIGPIKSMSLIENLPKFKWLYDYLKSIGLKFVEEDMSKKTLRGLKFALTGEGPLKRFEIQKLIEEKGGELKGINKDTNYLVTNDPDSKSGKMKSAKKFGIPVISYDKLFQEYLN
jgi:DNA ligase (NAD+)